LEKVMVEGKGFRRRVRPSPAPHAKQRLVGPGARHGGRPRREPTARRHRTRPGSFWEWVRRPGRRTRSHAPPPAAAPSADGTPPSRTSAWPPRGSGTRESLETSASRPPRRRTFRRRRGRVRCTSESWPGRPGGTAPSWSDRSPRARRTLHTLAWSSPRRNGVRAAAPATAYRKTRVEYARDLDSASNGRGPFGGMPLYGSPPNFRSWANAGLDFPSRVMLSFSSSARPSVLLPAAVIHEVGRIAVG